MNIWIQRIVDRLQGDKIIWMVALILCIWSLISVYGSISFIANKYDTHFLKLLLKHATFLGAGLGVMYVVHLVNYKYLSKLANSVYVIAVVILILTLIIGPEMNNAKRWLSIPILNLTVQTSDFAKIALVLWLAKDLHMRRKYLDEFRRHVAPMLLRIAIICGLILPEDLSTAALIGVVSMGMLFIGGVPWKGMFKIGGLVLGMGLCIYSVGKFAPDLLSRFSTWTNRIDQFIGFAQGSDVVSEGDYQIELAQVAIQRGGFLPTGPGTGTSRDFLPHPYSDMIYAFIIEEWGAIIGGLGLLLLYMILMYRTIYAAKNCDKPFGSYLAMGLGMMITTQALINMAVAVRLFPTTGQPLPLVSWGGTSIMITCMSIGMILAVSRAPTLLSKK
jgi:cell division protein FtsW